MQAMELIAILLSLSGFGVEKNPSPPASIDIVKYAPAQSDYMMYVDLETVLPKNYDAFLALPKQKVLRNSARALKPLLQAIKEAEAGRRLVKGMLGFDPARDVKHVALFANVPTRGPIPRALIVVRGSFPADLLDKVSNLANQQVRMVNGHPTITAPMNLGMIGFIAKDGTVLVGTSKWVTQALGATRKRRPARRSALARFARLVDQRPFMLLASSPSASSKRFLNRKLRGAPERLVADILTDHTFASLAVNHNGLSWSWTDTNKRGYQRALLGSKGIINTLRALQLGGRGMAQMGFAGLATYRNNRHIAPILKYQKALLAVLNDVSGSGKFKVRVNRRPRKLTVEVKAWGKKLSDVLPVGGVLPLVAAGAFLAGVDMRGARKYSSDAVRVRPGHRRRHGRGHSTGMRATHANKKTPSRVLRTYRRVKRAKLRRPHPAMRQ